MKTQVKLLFLTFGLLSVGGCGGKLAKKFLKPLGDVFYKVIIIKLFREILGLSDTQMIIFLVGAVSLAGIVYAVRELKKPQKDWKDVTGAVVCIVASMGLGWIWIDQVKNGHQGELIGGEFPNAIAAISESDSVSLGDQSDWMVDREPVQIRNPKDTKYKWDPKALRLMHSKKALRLDLDPDNRASYYRAILSEYIAEDNGDSIRAYMIMVIQDPLVAAEDIDIPVLDWKALGHGAE